MRKFVGGIVALSVFASSPAFASGPASNATTTEPLSIAASASGPAFVHSARSSAPERQVKDEKDDSDDGYGPFGPIRVGPLVGGGLLARPADIELFVKCWKLLGLGVEYAFLPKTTFDTIDVSAYSIGADARFFALSGSFFIGAGFGYQSASGTQRVTANVGAPVAMNATAEVNSLYVTPRMGWLFVADMGFTAGLDFGVTIPINPTTAVSASSPQALAYAQPQIDKASYFAKLPLPDAKLRLGFLF